MPPKGRGRPRAGNPRGAPQRSIATVDLRGVPSLPHEVLVDIFREDPDLVLSLLRSMMDLPPPGSVVGRDAGATFAELRPAEYRADAVLAFSDATDTARLVVIIEVQLGIDDDKRFAWPLYVAGAHARFRCPVVLAVVALDDIVGAWARMPIEIGTGMIVTATVIDGDVVPTITDPETVRREPELAILSLLAHARSPQGPAIGRAILLACPDLDEARAVFYADLVLDRIDRADLLDLELTMNYENYQVRSPFLRQLVEEGREDGTLTALADAIVRVLDARGLAVTAEIRARIEGCREQSVLEHWLVRAATVDEASDVFT